MTRLERCAFGAAVAVLGCSGAAARPSAQPKALAERCFAIQRTVEALKVKQAYVPLVLDWRDGDARTPIDEDALAERLYHGRPGAHTWVLARGGSGKSRLVDVVQAANCARRPVVRIDAAIDLRPQLAVATARRTALGLVLADQLGADAQRRTEDVIADAIGDQPWLLILDGTDELSQADRRALGKEMAWLATLPVAQPHFVRFERPGFHLGLRKFAPDGVAELPELSCDQADQDWNQRIGAAGVVDASAAWRTRRGLDRRHVAGGRCHYIYLATFRDTEAVADLAVDAGKGLDDLAAAPTRADVFSTWMAHRLRAAAPGTEAVLAWLDRVVSQGVGEGEPDFVLTLDRCHAAAPPGGSQAADACAALMASPVVKPGPNRQSWLPRNQTLTDVLLARWLASKHEECATLAAATADLASLELTGMVLSLPAGRRCLTPLIAAVCSRGTAVSDIAEFADEALPRDSEYDARLEMAQRQAATDCERAVIARLRTPVR